MKENESPGHGNLAAEIIEGGKGGILVSQHTGIIIDHHIHAEMILRINGYFYSLFRKSIHYLFVNLKIFSDGILFYKACFLQSLKEKQRASVHNRRFRAGNSDEHIVDTTCDKRGHDMLYCGDLDVFLRKD